MAPGGSPLLVLWRHKTSPSQETRLDAGLSLTFGRAPTTDVMLSDNPALSREAGVLVNLGDRAQIRCGQRTETGRMQIVLPGGHVAAYLTHGNEYVLADRAFDIRLVVGGVGGERYELKVVRGGGLKAPVDTTSGDVFVTHTADPLWDRAQILSPSSESDQHQWRTVVAIACAMTVTSHHTPPFGALKRRCTTFFKPGLEATKYEVSSHWLSQRLDLALAHLNIDSAGEDKIPLIVRAVVGARLIDDDELILEVARRVGLS